MKNDQITPQQKANKKQNEVRKGAPTFSSVRFKDENDLAEINQIIKKSGKTKEQALIAAFKALNEKIYED